MVSSVNASAFAESKICGKTRFVQKKGEGTKNEVRRSAKSTLASVFLCKKSKTFFVPLGMIFFLFSSDLDVNAPYHDDEVTSSSLLHARTHSRPPLYPCSSSFYSHSHCALSSSRSLSLFPFSSSCLPPLPLFVSPFC